jgi:aldehyde dehydrogenase (NAD+)
LNSNARVFSFSISHSLSKPLLFDPQQVNLNNPDWDITAPFGGYKQSGNGREYADWGIHDFLETKAIIGYAKPVSKL